jgi:hypothetical protein
MYKMNSTSEEIRGKVIAKIIMKDFDPNLKCEMCYS